MTRHPTRPGIRTHDPRTGRTVHPIGGPWLGHDSALRRQPPSPAVPGDTDEHHRRTPLRRLVVASSPVPCHPLRRESVSTLLTLYRPGLAAGRDAQALHRAATPDFFGWLEHTRAAAGCTRPIRLAGTITAVEPATGRVLPAAHRRAARRALYKACGNRRATVCPACAQIYQRDAYQLIRAGLTGGKGVPATVARHPAVFATFTAPSFGPVHHRHVASTPAPTGSAATAARRPATPAATAGTCPHGQPAACFARHDRRRSAARPAAVPGLLRPRPPGRLEPLLRRTVAAHQAGHRTPPRRTLPPTRHPPRPGRHRLRQDPPGAAGAAVARQGRRDASAAAPCTSTPCSASTASTPPTRTPSSRRRPASPSTTWTTPSTHAARQITVTTPPHPDRPDGWPIAWGEQLDIRPHQPQRRRRASPTAGRRLPRQVRHQGHRGHRPLLHPHSPPTPSTTTPTRTATTSPASSTPAGTSAAPPDTDAATDAATTGDRQGRP